MTEHVTIEDVGLPEESPGGSTYKVPLALLNTAVVSEDIIVRSGGQEKFLSIDAESSTTVEIQVETPLFGSRQYDVEVIREQSGETLDSSGFTIDATKSPSAAAPPPDSQVSFGQIPDDGYQIVDPNAGLGDQDADADALTVVVAAAAPDSVPEGQTYTLRMAVANGGSGPGDVKILSNIVDVADTVYVNQKTVSVGVTEVWEWQYQMTNIDHEYVVTAQDLDFNRSITFRGVIQSDPPASPEMYIADTRFPTEGPAGAMFTPAVAVGNRGNDEGTATLTVDPDGTTVEANIPAGSGEVFRPEVSTGEAGTKTFNIEVAGDGSVQDSTSVSIDVYDSSPEGGSTDTDESSDGSTDTSSQTEEEQQQQEDFNLELTGPRIGEGSGQQQQQQQQRQTRVEVNVDQPGGNQQQGPPPVLRQGALQDTPAGSGPGATNIDLDAVVARLVPNLSEGVETPSDEGGVRPISPLNPLLPLYVLRRVVDGEEL